MRDETDRGVPRESAEIYNNWFLHSTPASAIKQNNATGNRRHYANHYTFDRVQKD